MPRSGADARRRLQQAALELYGERGFEQTTTAQIAARAGVNERTFFRHFSDKREVLFDGEAALRAELVQSVAAAPEGLQALEVLLFAFRGASRVLEDYRPFSEPRLAVIAATPALRERELAKAASVTEAMAQALQERGVDDRLAPLAAQVGWATFHAATRMWIDDPSRDLETHLADAFENLHALCVRAPGPSNAP